MICLWSAKSGLSCIRNKVPNSFSSEYSDVQSQTLLTGEKEPMLRAAYLSEGDTFLDCTLGLGSDAIIASMAVGETGSVVGIEKTILCLF